jgi:hypothetical protein
MDSTNSKNRNLSIMLFLTVMASLIIEVRAAEERAPENKELEKKESKEMTATVSTTTPPVSESSASTAPTTPVAAVDSVAPVSEAPASQVLEIDELVSKRNQMNQDIVKKVKVDLKKLQKEKSQQLGEVKKTSELILQRQKVLVGLVPEDDDDLMAFDFIQSTFPQSKDYASSSSDAANASSSTNGNQVAAAPSAPSISAASVPQALAGNPYFGQAGQGQGAPGPMAGGPISDGRMGLSPQALELQQIQFLIAELQAFNQNSVNQNLYNGQMNPMGYPGGMGTVFPFTSQNGYFGQAPILQASMGGMGFPSQMGSPMNSPLMAFMSNQSRSFDPYRSPPIFVNGGQGAYGNGFNNYGNYGAGYGMNPGMTNPGMNRPQTFNSSTGFQF